MIRFLYSLCLTLLTPLVFLYFFWRGRREPGYRQNWRERLGFAPLSSGRPLWLHMASMGEFQAAQPLITELRDRWPDRSMLLTTVTPTGRVAIEQFIESREWADVRVAWLPLDLPLAVRRFLNRVQPCVAVILETEIWPNLFAGCRRLEVPILLANARLTQTSVDGYRRLGPLMTDALSCVSAVTAVGDRDAGRYRGLGVPADQVHVVGNLKFDVVPAQTDPALRATLAPDRTVWIAASTREGEESVVLSAHRRLREQFGDLLLILVPRHPQRFDAVSAMLDSRGDTYCRRSRGEIPDATMAVYLADTMGELQKLIGAADVAFVGATLVPIGGHNIIEPASVGVPVITGPNIGNVREAAALLEAVGALKQVGGEDGLVEQLSLWFSDPVARREAGAAGAAAVSRHRGAAEATLTVLAELLASNPASTEDLPRQQ